MRFSDNLPPVIPTPADSRVPGLSAVYAAKPVHARDPGTDHSASRAGHKAIPANDLPAPPDADRRLACRRIRQQKVLIELRSGGDRRQHNLLQGGIADHIDERA